MKTIGAPHQQIEDVVKGSGLFPLTTCSYATGDKGLLSAFVERWHKETNSFHLPVGEMTITLDDVSSLLHIPITGAFYSFHHMDAEAAKPVLIEMLGVLEEDATAETKFTRGGHVRLSWLRILYEQRCQEQQWTQAARAYLLHLVGCTIFANKSSTYVDVTFLGLFRDLEGCGVMHGAQLR